MKKSTTKVGSKLKKCNKEKGFLYYIYCALGEKSHPHCNKTADRVAFIRLLITLQILITNLFIVAGVIRHWNDSPPITIYQYHEVPSRLSETKEKNSLKTNRSTPNGSFLYD